MRWVSGMIVVAVAAGAVVGCGPPATTAPTASPTPAATEGAPRFPDVLDATLARSDGTWTLSATISSPYDSQDRYADAFRALTPDGEVLGVRELLHAHPDEQPFTRSLTGLEIPPDVEAVTVQARDLRNGWGGTSVTVEVPGSG